MHKCLAFLSSQEKIIFTLPLFAQTGHDRCNIMVLFPWPLPILFVLPLHCCFSSLWLPFSSLLYYMSLSPMWNGHNWSDDMKWNDIRKISIWHLSFNLHVMSPDLLRIEQILQSKWSKQIERWWNIFIGLAIFVNKSAY